MIGGSKLQITNYKFQTNSKFKCSKFKKNILSPLISYPPTYIGGEVRRGMGYSFIFPSPLLLSPSQREERRFISISSPSLWEGED